MIRKMIVRPTTRSSANESENQLRNMENKGSSRCVHGDRIAKKERN